MTPFLLSLLPRRHLKQLLEDDERTQAMVREAGGVYLDFSRQNATPETLKASNPPPPPP